MLSVTCTIVKGDFPVKLTWSFNNQPVKPNHSDINIVNDRRVSFLSIDSVAARHAGNYTCTATNAAGFDSHVAVLRVNGRAINDYCCLSDFQKSLSLRVFVGNLHIFQFFLET